MNRQDVRCSALVLRITSMLVLALITTVALGRELTWKQHAVAEPEPPRKLSVPMARPLPRKTKVVPKQKPARKEVVSEAADQAPEAAVSTVATASQAEAELALEPIPVADARQVRDGVAPPRRQMRQAGYQSAPFRVQPWHPHPAYAGSYSRHPRMAQGFGPMEPGPAGIGPGEVIDELGAGPEGFGDGCCGGCGAPGCSGPWTANCPQCDPGFLSGVLYASAALGVEGFKGPVDQGRNGNFGFAETINFSGPALGGRLGYQFGFRFVQSNFNGDQTLGAFRDDTRTQTFFTVGLFRRASDCCPWQFGIALDLLRDNYYYKADLSQLRIELSRQFCCNWEFGTLLIFGTGDDSNVANANGITVMDQYTLFLRRPIGVCGEARLLAGVSSNGGGLLGGEFWLPVSDRFALEGNFGYLFADGSDAQRQQEDSYGIGMNIVWYPYCRALRSASSRYRALFPVANNGRFFLDLK